MKKNIHRLLTILAVLVFAITPALMWGKTYVVVVGVDVENSLHGIPAHMTKRMAQFYKYEQNAEVFLMLDKNATYSNVVSVMKKMFGKANKGDAIVFVYNGHGYIKSSWAAGGITMAGSKRSLGYDEIQNIMKSSKATYKMAFIDACYSGGITSKNKNTVVRNNSYQQRQNVNVMIYSSAPGNSPGYILTNGRQYISFLDYCLEGMKGAADANKDNKVTARELFNWVNPRCIETLSVHPQMWGKFDNNLVVSYLKVGSKK